MSYKCACCGCPIGDILFDDYEGCPKCGCMTAEVIRERKHRFAFYVLYNTLNHTYYHPFHGWTSSPGLAYKWDGPILLNGDGLVNIKVHIK